MQLAVRETYVNAFFGDLVGGPPASPGGGVREVADALQTAAWRGIRGQPTEPAARRL